jgi:hypothetical protein
MTEETRLPPLSHGDFHMGVSRQSVCEHGDGSHHHTLDGLHKSDSEICEIPFARPAEKEDDHSHLLETQ